MNERLLCVLVESYSVKEDELILGGIDKYNELCKTVEMRALDSVMIGLQKILKYFILSHCIYLEFFLKLVYPITL